MRNMVNNKGFTLIELLVVLAILGAIIGIVGLAVIPLLGEGDLSSAKADVENYSSAVELYAVENGGALPEENGNGEIIDALAEHTDFNPELVNGNGMPEAPWDDDDDGHPVKLQYEVENNDFILYFKLEDFDGSIDEDDVIGDGWNEDDYSELIVAGGSVVPGVAIIYVSTPSDLLND